MGVVGCGKPCHYIPFIILAVIITDAKQMNNFFAGKSKSWVYTQIVTYIFYAKRIEAAGRLKTKIIIVHI